MPEAKVEEISEKKITVAIQLIVMVALASLLPLFPLQQITGPLVNALLYIAVVMLGVNNALLICFLPSVVAISTGLLPILMLPLIPVIIVGNILLVLMFSRLREKNFWLGVGVASLLKYIFIYSLASILASQMIQQPPFAKVVSTMMGLPQLVNALLGGIIAWIFLKSIKRI